MQTHFPQRTLSRRPKDQGHQGSCPEYDSGFPDHPRTKAQAGYPETKKVYTPSPPSPKQNPTVNHLTSPFLHAARRERRGGVACVYCLSASNFSIFASACFRSPSVRPKVTVQPRDHTLAPFVPQPEARIVPTLRARLPSFVPQT
jgi:hypothetical protein